MCGGGGGFLGGIGKAISGAISGIGRAISTIAKNPIFQAVAPIALNFFLPGLGLAASSALGLSAAWAPAIGGALVGGFSGAVSGGGARGILKGAAIGGLAAGAADFAMSGTNPLSGVFSGNEGGAASNALTAGGTGSTNLTGVGAGLGTDSSTIGTQFGAGAAPSAPSNFGLNPGGGSAFGQLTPSATPGGFNQIVDPLSGLNAAGLKAAAGPPSFLSSLQQGNLGDAAGSAWRGAKGLLPESNLGKIGVGLAGLSLLNGMGGQEQPQGGGQPAQDPTFTQRLAQQNFQWNPNEDKNRNWGAYGQRQGSRAANSYGIDPMTGLPLNAPDQNDASAYAQQQGEHRFFNPTTTPVAQAARGGMMYSMGGLAQAYAQGRMVSGPGDGVSDDIASEIDGQRKAQISSGEFIIPARIVSEIGAGSSEAGASRLEEMLKRINERRFQNKDYAKDTKAYNLLPA